MRVMRNDPGLSVGVKLKNILKILNVDLRFFLCCNLGRSPTCPGFTHKMDILDAKTHGKSKIPVILNH